jgi:hypothetical protein
MLSLHRGSVRIASARGKGQGIAEQNRPRRGHDFERREDYMAFIRHPKDFFAGLLFIAFGVAAIVIGSNYALGTAARMGPGYFPRILGILLISLGAILAIRALRLQGTPIPGFKWWPTTIVLGSVVVFGLVVEHLGLFVSTIGLIFVSSMASHEFRWKEAIGSGIFFALLAVAVFVLGLKLQLPIWPVFLFGSH